MPKVSVIIPAYNAAKHIRTTLNSVLDQTCRDFEVIVVDDGSTDGTVEILKTYSDRVLWTVQKHQGQAYAINRGIRMAKGEYLAYLDADDLIMPAKLEVQAGYLDKNPDVDVVYSDMYYTERQKKRELVSYEPLDPFLLLQRCCVCRITVMHRRGCLDKVGLFNEAITGSDDWDMWVRMSECCNMAHIDQALSEYRIHGENTSHKRIKRLNHFRWSRMLILRDACERRGSPFWLRVMTWNAGFQYLIGKTPVLGERYPYLWAGIDRVQQFCERIFLKWLAKNPKRQIRDDSKAVTGGKKLRVLSVIPGAADDPGSMVFARRQTDVIESHDISVEKFFLGSRTSPLTLIREWLRLRQMIAKFNPDVLHCHYGTMTAFIGVCATSRPVVITYRGSDLNPVPSGNYLRTLFSHVLSQISALRASRIICVSRELVGRLLWRRDKATIIPTGVDTVMFKPMPQIEARALLNWDVKVPVVLFNAGCSPEVKRLDLAEQAVVEAKRSLPNIKFAVLRGDVPPDDIPLYHNAADVLLVTSDFEGSPTIVQEAAACGLPVVSVDVGDVPERLHSVIPSKIAPRDAVSLGSALLEVISLKRRSNGPEIAAMEFSNAVVVSRVIKVLTAASFMHEI